MSTSNTPTNANDANSCASSDSNNHIGEAGWGGTAPTIFKVSSDAVLAVTVPDICSVLLDGIDFEKHGIRLEVKPERGSLSYDLTILETDSQFVKALDKTN